MERGAEPFMHRNHHQHPVARTGIVGCDLGAFKASLNAPNGFPRSKGNSGGALETGRWNRKL